MVIRLHLGPPVDASALVVGASFDLPPQAARHLQVLRAQPGERIECFDGHGRGWWAEVLAMKRHSVEVRLVDDAPPIDAELPVAVTLCVGMPANDRMDGLVEKAVELGAASLQPLVCERSVLRLSGERAERKVAHWQAVAASASEQCGRRVVPVVHPVQTVSAWLQGLDRDLGSGAHAVAVNGPDPVSSRLGPPGGRRVVLSLQMAAARTAPVVGASAEHRFAVDSPAAMPLSARPTVLVLSGPEGGLSADEEAAAVAAGFVRQSLGGRVLRADTAPLAWLARLGVG